ncbi:hypothetical protein Poli38472_006987 [Pythium oligandrum]|uniref:EF-hand domain-containing protein n=1 Tax=Pythium oligandrum TaxID=41045 RepID=A0A8K1CAE2_PYTOL|nr:hypothetical protein Poli38472_006987 [Pythium oligandrum]|eukprot:TMW58842.1 hypothetical protein Poli38472_006987 [Pythium oligandrum]
MYGKHCYRVAVLTHLRRLAVAIRFFRRVIVPWLIKAFRRRRRAAIKIQRCFRRHLHWKQTVLRSFVVRFVNRVIETGLRRVLAGRRIARRLHLQYKEKKRREALARERRRVIYRWVAKTRVCLFVHTVWCVRFFRRRREENLQAIRTEISTLEQSDRDVRVEYSTIFRSAFGRSLLKKELKEWRERVKNQSVPPQVAPDTSESVETGSAIARLRRCFEIFDLDGSGALDLEEFHLMLSYLRNVLNDKTSNKPMVRPKLTTAQVRDLFEVLDCDGNGMVTREELESWWTQQQQALSSLSASVSFLATGMNRLVLTGHGMLFWLLGKKQQLERKFVKKLLVKQAMESAKRVLLTQLIQDQSSETRRCPKCARRFGLIRDWKEHQADCTANEWMVDTFVLHKWKREEELRLLEEDGGW